MKRALILGIQGQDGALLAKHLLDKGYEVFGGAREINNFKNWRLIQLGILSQINIARYEIHDPSSLKALMEASVPAEIYLLAGESKTYSSFDNPLASTTEQIIAHCNLFDLALKLMPNVKIFVAGSSEMFGFEAARPSLLKTRVVNEFSSCFPANPYGVGKLSAFELARIYREFHGLHIVTGILFNHESQFREKEFVTRKISFNLARLKIYGGEPITLGNLDNGRDWSFAVDVVKVMQATLQASAPKDYIISSGKISTVRDFFAIAAEACGFLPVFQGAGLNEICVCQKSNLVLMKINPKNFRVLDTPILIGDNSSLRNDLGINLSCDINDLAMEMINADLNRWSTGNLTH